MKWILKNVSRWQNNDYFCSHCVRAAPCAIIESFSDTHTPKLSEISIFSEIFRLGKVKRKSKIFSDITIPQNGSDVTYLNCSETVMLFSRSICPENIPDPHRYRENRCLGRTYNFPRHTTAYTTDQFKDIGQGLKNCWHRIVSRNTILVLRFSVSSTVDMDGVTWDGIHPIIFLLYFLLDYTPYSIINPAFGSTID